MHVSRVSPPLARPLLKNHQMISITIIWLKQRRFVILYTLCKLDFNHLHIFFGHSLSWTVHVLLGMVDIRLLAVDWIGLDWIAYFKMWLYIAWWCCGRVIILERFIYSLLLIGLLEWTINRQINKQKRQLMSCLSRNITWMSSSYTRTCHENACRTWHDQENEVQPGTKH